MLTFAASDIALKNLARYKKSRKLFNNTVFLNAGGINI